MKKTVQDIMQMIEVNDIKMIDFKMVDINGQFRHVTIPAKHFSEETMRNGIGFDASNYGYAVVEKSDMVFIPDPDTAVIDPFCQIPTLSMTGNAMIIDNPENRPINYWKGHANLLYGNWLNYFVYQRTPFDLSELK